MHLAVQMHTWLDCPDAESVNYACLPLYDVKVVLHCLLVSDSKCSQEEIRQQDAALTAQFSNVLDQMRLARPPRPRLERQLSASQSLALSCTDGLSPVSSDDEGIKGASGYFNPSSSSPFPSGELKERSRCNESATCMSVPASVVTCGSGRKSAIIEVVRGDSQSEGEKAAMDKESSSEIPPSSTPPLLTSSTTSDRLKRMARLSRFPSVDRGSVSLEVKPAKPAVPAMFQLAKQSPNVTTIAQVHKLSSSQPSPKSTSIDVSYEQKASSPSKV